MHSVVGWVVTDGVVPAFVDELVDAQFTPATTTANATTAQRRRRSWVRTGHCVGWKSMVAVEVLMYRPVSR
jgi:hypothetical protein